MKFSLEFWGVEVKAGESVKVVLDEGSTIHMSQAALGDSKGKGKGFIPLRVKIEDKKFILGSLSEENIPHVKFDLVFHTEFELSHDSKDASVFFLGYKGEINYESDSEYRETCMKLLASSNGVEPKSDNKPNDDEEEDSSKKEETPKEVNRGKKRNAKSPLKDIPSSSTKKAKVGTQPSKPLAVVKTALHK